MQLAAMADEEQQPQQAKYVDYTIDVNTDEGVVSVVLTQSAMKKNLTPDLINEQLSAHQVTHWKIDASAIEDAIHKFKKNIATRIVIGQRIDAQFQLVLSADHMTAAVKVTPAQGGEELQEDALLAALSEKKVDAKRIIAAAVKQAVQSDTEREIVVAAGKRPKRGRDSQFIPLLPPDSDQAELEEDESGKVDYYAGKHYFSIEAGTPLMERTPPLAGQVGMDIFGQIIPAEAGKEIPFDKDLTGTEFASNDPNLLIAQISGHPVYSPTGVKVDNTLSFKNVDVSTGHIRFDGSVNITGDVMPGMKVEATGDVFIKGAVERATVKAGSNVHIGGGILGDTSIHFDEEDGLPPLDCFVEAGGEVTARYINLAHVIAKTFIEVREYAFNSKLQAGTDIRLGQNGGKGNLVGGEAIAGHNVSARILGNQAYNPTKVRVGITTEQLQTVQKLKFLREQRLNQARGLRKILDKLKQQSSATKLGQIEIDKAKKVHETLLSLQSDLKALDDRLVSFNIPKLQDEEPHITATSACFPNCDLTINGATHKTTQEHKAMSYVKRGRKITVKT